MRRLLLASLVLSACQVDADPAARPEVAHLQPVYDDTVVPMIYGGAPPDAPEHAAVVGLHQLSGGSVYVKPFCTGTLIADDVVLTAAHCLDTAKGGKPSFQTMSPSALAIYVGDDPSQDLLQHLYLVSETLINPGYDRFRIRNDIALVRLSSPITEPVTPIQPLPPSEGFSAADAGMTVNFAGFGEIESGDWGVKLQVDLPIAGVGCSVSGCPDAGDAATQVSYHQSFGGPCFGDSGGPFFVYRTSGTYVGGITSYGDSYCTIYGVSTRVDAFATMIADFVGSGGPGDTDPPAGDCGDGVCGVGESCDGRGGTTACSSDCDGKTGGKPAARFCYVEGTCEGPGCP